MELSVRILQMDAAQLTDYLKEVMLENPVVELEPPREQDDKREFALRKLEWLDSQSRHEKENVGYYDEDNDLTLEKTVGASDEESLVEHLLAQVGLCAAAPDLLTATRYIVGCIDDNGYLTAPRDELIRDSRLDGDLLSRTLALARRICGNVYYYSSMRTSRSHDGWCATI